MPPRMDKELSFPYIGSLEPVNIVESATTRPHSHPIFDVIETEWLSDDALSTGRSRELTSHSHSPNKASPPPSSTSSPFLPPPPPPPPRASVSKLKAESMQKRLASLLMPVDQVKAPTEEPPPPSNSEPPNQPPNQPPDQPPSPLHPTPELNPGYPWRRLSAATSGSVRDKVTEDKKVPTSSAQGDVRTRTRWGGSFTPIVAPPTSTKASHMTTKAAPMARKLSLSLSMSTPAPLRSLIPPRTAPPPPPPPPVPSPSLSLSPRVSKEVPRYRSHTVSSSGAPSPRTSSVISPRTSSGAITSPRTSTNANKIKIADRKIKPEPKVTNAPETNVQRSAARALSVPLTAKVPAAQAVALPHVSPSTSISKAVLPPPVIQDEAKYEQSPPDLLEEWEGQAEEAAGSSPFSEVGWDLPQLDEDSEGCVEDVQNNVISEEEEEEEEVEEVPLPDDPEVDSDDPGVNDSLALNQRGASPSVAMEDSGASCPASPDSNRQHVDSPDPPPSSSSTEDSPRTFLCTPETVTSSSIPWLSPRVTPSAEDMVPVARQASGVLSRVLSAVSFGRRSSKVHDHSTMSDSGTANNPMSVLYFNPASYDNLASDN